MNETVSLETREVRFLSVFDFDGTLTYRDSFVPFLRFAFGNRVFVRRMLRMAGPSLAYLCRRIGRDDLKARLIATFLTDVPVHVLEERALAYQNRFWETLMRPHALTAVADQVSSGSTVTICSASPSLLLRPFAEARGAPDRHRAGSGRRRTDRQDRRPQLPARRESLPPGAALRSADPILPARLGRLARRYGTAGGGAGALLETVPLTCCRVWSGPSINPKWEPNRGECRDIRQESRIRLTFR